MFQDRSGVTSIQHTVTKSYTPIPGYVTEAGQSTVYKAIDDDLGRTVCLKRMHVDGETRPERAANYRRLQSEIQPLLLLGDQNVRVPVFYDKWFDEQAGDLYIAMQWIEGKSLEKWLSDVETRGQRPSDVIPQARMLGWMADLCDILSRMARVDLYHKDIKPANLMIDGDGQLWLIDFGISIATANLVEGTPGYRAPEMEPGSKHPNRDKVDMYAIGIILYRYYTGVIPQKSIDYALGSKFDPKGGSGEVWKRYTEPKAYNDRVPQAVNDIIMRCLKYNPDDRYAEIKDLAYALRGAVPSGPRNQHNRNGQRNPQGGNGRRNSSGGNGHRNQQNNGRRNQQNGHRSQQGGNDSRNPSGGSRRNEA